MTLVQACREYFETLNLAPMRRAVVGQEGALAIAARNCLKGGRHAGDCDYSLPDGACSVHVETFHKRRANLLRLTEEAIGTRARGVA
jgi:hypothetical protein